MPDPITSVGLGAVAAYLSKDGIAKLLGPTADYLGNGLRDLTQKRVENIGRIFASAQSKLGGRLEEPGEVPPKVLKSILNDGSFATDSVSVEYLGGILASSRTELGRDDRGARLAKLVDGLSTYQLRTHYLVYSTVRTLFAGKGLAMDMNGRPKMQLFLPFTGYFSAMDFSASELQQLPSLLPHIFFGIHNESLIEGDWRFGPPASLTDYLSTPPEAGVVLQPSALGAELFLWAFGQADKPLDHIFSSSFDARLDGVPDCVVGSLPTKP